MAHFGKEAGVALLFAILYFGLAVWMVFCFATHRFKIKSRWAILAFHTFVRVASQVCSTSETFTFLSDIDLKQACGVAFGILAFGNTDVFIAYLILGQSTASLRPLGCLLMGVLKAPKDISPWYVPPSAMVNAASISCISIDPRVVPLPQELAESQPRILVPSP